MPKIINAYAPDDSLATALSGLASSFMGGNGAQTELYRQKALEARNANINLPLAAAAAANGDTAGLTRYGIMSGLSAPNASGYNRMSTISRAPDVNDPSVTRAMLGAGDSFASTPQGVNQAETNRLAIENRRTDRSVEAAKYATDNTPQVYLDPKGQVVIGRRSETFGQPAALDEGAAKGNIIQRNLPTMTPEQQAQVGGYAPKPPANLFVYKTPDGIQGTTADGKTDQQTGAPLPPNTPVMKLEGADTSGLTPDHPVNRAVLESRIATRQATASIDGTIAELSKPDAGAAIGVLGQGARLFNDLRAQAEAATKLAGRGPGAAIELSNPDVQNAADVVSRTLFGDPNFNIRAQQLGIDSAVLKSRVMDLAFTIAKAKDPGGKISKDDITNAGHIVGSSLMDPQAGIQVLGNLRDTLLKGQNIREEETRRLYPSLKAWEGMPTATIQPPPTAGAPQIAPAQGAPAAPIAAPAAIDPEAARQELRRRGIIQ